MGEEKTIRGRPVIYERNGPPRGPAEDLRYTFDVIDERGNQLERARPGRRSCHRARRVRGACAKYRAKRG
jgi:hypothetical protein